MQTTFSREQLAQPLIAESDRILRKCVHCGFCTATCPTFVLLGDELDSPRGRIYLIKDMLENDRPATEKVVKHIDRCLTCLACMTTCPSGVDYMHLVDGARAHIEETYRRPWADRMLRDTLAFVLPDRRRFRASLAGSWFARLALPLIRRIPGLEKIAAMLALTPSRLPPRSEAIAPARFPVTGRKGRVVLMTGCAQAVLAPGINEAAVRLLNRAGIEVVMPEGEGCCGALVHHLGKADDARAQARRNVDAWMREIEGEGLDAILVSASGCGTTVKDYGHLLAGDPAYAEKAARVAGLARDVSEYVETLDLGPPVRETGQAVAYHAACSMQHGQQITRQPKELLATAGFDVREVPEGHLCCGSAGVYNILQPEIAGRLRDRKLANIARTEPQMIATGNIGCMTQLAAKAEVPVVHTVELLDWAYGGPQPAALEGREK
ncbi:glycolate oxidase subunit GlcF [Rhodobium gokarnense]|uniref:Glycolate oxidase iron-sulfur subunit n=1 Tax=Rhodobium gokarnense TaxID=364296 RepID=A0ABT3HCJ7_9HYPH|nr:glycolate oxidase subunit GlcF [Rhodobium gokarnense]MCW2308127.1 glycolate oxidase iron-sulfur subunit [Rhodobium gokarnense]